MICPLSSLTLLLPLPLLTLTPLALTIIFLYMYSSHTNTYFILFFCDAIHTCNSLPYSVMSLPSLNSFKKTVIVVLLLCCFFTSGYILKLGLQKKQQQKNNSHDQSHVWSLCSCHWTFTANADIPITWLACWGEKQFWVDEVYKYIKPVDKMSNLRCILQTKG